VNTKVVNAVERLNKILPLVQHKQNLSNELADVYLNILHSYFEKGKTMSRDDIAQQVFDIDECINTLKNIDMVVFDSNDNPVGAYPFTMEQREHEVTVNAYKVHCMCALDALAVSPVFELDTVIHSSCHVMKAPVSIRQHKLEILNTDDNSDVLFGISWSSAADNYCATSLCTEMIFLKDKQVSKRWQTEDAGNRELFDLRDAVDFTAAFFEPLTSKQAA